MKRISTFSLVVLILYAFCFHASSQNKADSLTEEMKSKMYNTFKHFTFGFYIDSYCNLTLDDRHDTSNVVPFAANCPVRDQIRLNYAALEMYYNAEKVRGKFVLQYGDAPNLLASPDAQFIKSIRQANFGFRIVKNLWVDLGYLFNPVEYESAWPVINQISTVTIGGYFSPGSVLGIKFSYKFNDKFSGGIMAGNPFSLAYQHNTRIAGIIFLTYKPLPNLSLNYNNFFGNQALKTAEIKNNTVYNNIFVTYDPVKQVGF